MGVCLSLETCPVCRVLLSMLGQEDVWSNLCTSCCSYFYFTRFFMSGRSGQFAREGESSFFPGTEDWYFEQEPLKSRNKETAFLAEGGFYIALRKNGVR